MGCSGGCCKISLVVTFIVAVYLPSAIATCTLLHDAIDPRSGTLQAFHISETDPSGTVIITGTKAPTDGVHFNVAIGLPTAYRNELHSLFSMNSTATTFKILNTKPIDLEMLYWKYKRDNSRIVINIHCGNNSNIRVIAVDPVDEFPPELSSTQYHISIPETTHVGSTIFRVSTKVHDEDIPSHTQALVYTAQELNGTLYFACDSRTGDITLQKYFDYEAPGSLSSLTLTVGITEVSGRRSSNSATLVVDITNVEDLPPYFIYPGCPTPCMVPLYETLTTLTFTGLLKLHPTPIQGGDNEGFGTQLEFAIIRGNDDNMFQIDPIRGTVTQKDSVQNTKVQQSEFRLIIEMKKIGSADLKALAVLMIRVKERLDNTTAYLSRQTFNEKPTIPSRNESDLSLLIPLIVVSVAFAITLSAIIYLFKRKMLLLNINKSKVNPLNPNGLFIQQPPLWHARRLPPLKNNIKALNTDTDEVKNNISQ